MQRRERRDAENGRRLRRIRGAEFRRMRFDEAGVVAPVDEIGMSQDARKEAAVRVDTRNRRSGDRGAEPRQSFGAVATVRNDFRK
jgi:hypothetical protein